TAAYCQRPRVPSLGKVCPGLFSATQSPRTGAIISKGACGRDRGAALSNTDDAMITRAMGGAQSTGTTPMIIIGIIAKQIINRHAQIGCSVASIRIIAPPAAGSSDSAP